MSKDVISDNEESDEEVNESTIIIEDDLNKLRKVEDKDL